MPRQGTALTRFLRKYSRKGTTSRNVYKLYAQWKLVEIRDSGKRRQLRCHCGRKNLRYIAFIQNKYTGIQTYVGTDCVKYFSRHTVPALLKLLDGLAVQGVSAVYRGRKGNVHRFCLSRTSPLVRHHRLLRHFFRRVPLRRSSGGGWEVRMIMGRKFCKPKLRKGRCYKVIVGAVTPLAGKKKGQKPRLLFYVDRMITRS